MSVTKQDWAIDQNIIRTVVERQSDSLEKAILEGAMNSVDAKAKNLDITITTDSVKIVDDGVGIKTKRELKEHFGTFGKPHEESEDKRYGRFRMGRAQLLIYGKNCWRTHCWEMRVDWRNDISGYTVERQSKNIRGCRIDIDLYEELPSFVVSSKVRSLTRWLAYLPISVRINGEQVNRDPEKEKWTYETNDAYIRLSDSDHELHVYNDGIYCRSYGAYMFGTGGVVVSKRGLKVNFARNTVQDDCPVWKRIKKKISGRVNKELYDKKRLTKDERVKLASLIVDGEVECDRAAASRFIPLVTGKFATVRELLFRNTITIAPKGDRAGDLIHRMGKATVLSEEALSMFGVGTLFGFLELLASQSNDGDLARQLRELNKVDFAQLRSQFTSGFKVVHEADLSTKEKVWLDVISSAGQVFLYLEGRGGDGYAAFCRRQIYVGISSEAEGWTDGESYIAIERAFLKRQNFDVVGFSNLASLLLHEYCHGEQDMTAHDHDQAFFELFHDNAHKIGSFVQRALKRLHRSASKYDYELPKTAREAVELVST